MKLKRIIMVFISVSICFIVFKLYGYKIFGIEKFVGKRISCAEYSNGGGEMIVTYIILKFSKDEVLYYTENSHHLSNGDEQSFKYSKKDNHIYIKRHKDDFILADTMTIFGDTLRGCCATEFIKQ